MLRPSRRLAVTVGRVLLRARRYDALVLDGSARSDQVAATLLRLRRRRGGPPLVIADATWKVPPGAIAARGKLAAMRLIDGERTTFCVLTRVEAERFGATWALRRSRVRFTPWPVTRPPAEAIGGPAENGRVFAGGNSLREYGPLIEAAREIGAGVDIATSSPASPAGDHPTNVSVRRVAPEQYEAMLRAASVVVVPLQARPDRSSGQTTYVNAMALGKAIVVTDAPGVRDYIEDGETGLIVPCGDAAAMACAVRSLLGDAERRRGLGESARRHASAELTMSRYAERLLAIVDETLGSSARTLGRAEA